MKRGAREIERVSFDVFRGGTNSARNARVASVLIIDPDDNLRTMLRSYIHGLGHVVEMAADAANALAKLERHRFEIVFTDVELQAGASLLAEIRRRSPETVVLLTTAWATVPLAVEALRNGATDYLIKPFFSVHQIAMILSESAAFRS